MGKLKTSFLFLISSISFFYSSLTAQPEMILVEGGRFVMGCTPEQGGDCSSGEYPAHAVNVGSFHIGKYEVTQAQWQSVMGDNPSLFHGCGINCPVEMISWYSMIVFCNVLTLQQMGGSYRVYYKDAAMTQPWSISDYYGGGETPAGAVYWNNTKNGYRLPTEAEWEFAARGGNQSQGYKYAGSNVIGDVAWYAGYTTHQVGTKEPNELIIYDMSGNVWESTWDRYLSTYYSTQRVCDPQGPGSGSTCVLRGGSCLDYAIFCRVSNRSYTNPANRGYSLGFRLAHSL